MCTGILHLPSPQGPVGCHVSTPHRIWGPRLLPLQQPCSTDQVGLAIVVAIQAELDWPAPSPKANQPVPPAHLAITTSPQMQVYQVPRDHAAVPTNKQMPGHRSDQQDVTRTANEQTPHHSSRPGERPRHHVGPQPRSVATRPSLFTVSSSSGWDTASQPQFSSSCFLCKRPLPSNKDIYMYRGDQAFCTKQCRHHQMVVDERKKKLRLHSLTSTFIAKNCRIDSCTTSHHYNDKEGIYA